MADIVDFFFVTFEREHFTKNILFEQLMLVRFINFCWLATEKQSFQLTQLYEATYARADFLFKNELLFVGFPLDLE